ncbi:MAG TPA: hypothetical protein VIT23_06170, partial [Terrimicrobiaceae bacterium]
MALWVSLFLVCASASNVEDNDISRELFTFLRGRGRQKPFFLRWWFYVPLAAVAFACIAAWSAWAYFSYRLERRAAEFDLTQLERMEAASIIYDRGGKELGKIFIQNRNPVALDKISPLMVKAVIAAEDNKFFQH